MREIYRLVIECKSEHRETQANVKRIYNVYTHLVVHTSIDSVSVCNSSTNGIYTYNCIPPPDLLQE